MDWSYIAGFFDGEGSVTHTGKGYRVTLPQTNEEVLLKIKAFTGTGSILFIPKRRNHWSDSWVYYIARQADVLAFLLNIESLVIVKQKLVKKIIPELRAVVEKQGTKKELYHYRKVEGKKLRALGLTYREIGRRLKVDWGYERRLILDLK